MSDTSSGIQENVAGLLCYVLGWVTGIIFLILEKDNLNVRFHAKQSIVVFGFLTAILIVLRILALIPFLDIFFIVLSSLIGLFGFILWIVLMVKAYQGEMYKLPVAGNIAEKWVV